MSEEKAKESVILLEDGKKSVEEPLIHFHTSENKVHEIQELLQQKEHECEMVWNARSYFLDQLEIIKSTDSWKIYTELKEFGEQLCPFGSTRRKVAWGLLRFVGKTYFFIKPILFLILSKFNGIVTKTSVKIRGMIKKRRNDHITVSIVNERWHTEKPLVSVIIPCYNYGRYIWDAIRSVLAQTFKNFEIIVVNDGSTDENTIQILQEIAHPRIKILHQSNCGLSATRNNGINASRGKYICCLDADDILDPTYLEKCLYWMEKNHLDMCGSWLREFGDSDLIFQTYKQDLESLKKENLQVVATVFKKKMWEKTGGYSVEMDQGYEDWEFWISILEAGGRGDIIPEPLFLYRKHGRTMLSEARNKHDMLLSKINQLHPGLHSLKPYKSNRGKLKAVHYIVSNPFINLKGVKTKKNILLAIPYMTIGGATKVLERIFGSLNNEYGISIVSTQVAPESMGDTTETFGKITGEIYQLCKFLENEFEREEFIHYLIETREIDLIFIAGSEMLYKILPEIKRRHPLIKVLDQLYNDIGHIKNNRRYKELIDLNIVENEDVQNSLVNKHGEYKSKIELIHNGVDVAYFKRENVDGMNRKKKFNIPDDKFVFSFIGRFSEEKAPGFFVEIAAQCLETWRKRIVFIMAGNGPLFKDIQRLIRKKGLEDHFCLPGFCDTREILSFTDVLLLPSFIDGRPNIVLEALSMSVPVICSNLGGLPWLVANERTGYLCAPGNMAEFKNKMELLLNDPDKCRQFGANARQFALENLDNERPLQQYAQVIDRLLNGNKHEV